MNWPMTWDSTSVHELFDHSLFRLELGTKEDRWGFGEPMVENPGDFARSASGSKEDLRAILTGDLPLEESPRAAKGRLNDSFVFMDSLLSSRSRSNILGTRLLTLSLERNKTDGQKSGKRTVTTLRTHLSSTSG